MISIIVPVHNMPVPFVIKCIESIVSQTYSDWEMLLLDDGMNSDDSFACEHAAAADSRIRWLQNAGKNVSAKRNLGISESRGDWLCFLDCDDWVEVNTLEILSNTATTTDADIVVCNTYVDYPSYKKPLFPSNDQLVFFDKREVNEIQQAMLAGMALKGCAYLPLSNYTWGKMIKKELVETETIFFPNDIQPMEDTIFWLYAFN